MLRDNYNEYHHQQTRGIPRSGKALLHGLLYCGECGHKMTVRYNRSAADVCNHLRREYGAPVCQHLPAQPVDQAITQAFLQALSPIELDIYSRALAAHKQSEDQAHQARLQQIERLRYQAHLAQRQFNRVDPENRLVAAELEARWESALRELKQAEEALAQTRQVISVPFAVTAELKTAFTSIGERLPQIWEQDLLSSEQKKALLRCLIEKIVLHRLAPDCVQARIVWVGHQTTALRITVLVRSLAALSKSQEMEKLIISLASKGIPDEEIARELTAQGYRSPTC